MRSRHPDKDIEEAVQLAEQSGWIVTLKKRGHSWGVIRCPCECECQSFVYSTPRNPRNHADQIKRALGRCENN